MEARDTNSAIGFDELPRLCTRCNPAQICFNLLEECELVVVAKAALQENRGAGGLELALGEDGDAIGEDVGFVHVVCGQQHGPALFVLLQQTPDLLPRVHVHSRRRLVQNHKLKEDQGRGGRLLSRRRAPGRCIDDASSHLKQGIEPRFH